MPLRPVTVRMTDAKPPFLRIDNDVGLTAAVQGIGVGVGVAVGAGVGVGVVVGGVEGVAGQGAGGVRRSGVDQLGG